MRNSQHKTVEDWKIAVTPAKFAFAIWGIIYLLIMGFTIYQALPSTWLPNRNDMLIFG
jgi:benzodiazapine receptor